jgi:hypothetical protein
MTRDSRPMSHGETNVQQHHDQPRCLPPTRVFLGCVGPTPVLGFGSFRP